MQTALRNLQLENSLNNLKFTFFSIVDQKENTKINYRFRDLKYSFKNYSKKKNLKIVDTEEEKQMKYFEFSAYPNFTCPIKFEEISFITTCDNDKSKNDRYLQKFDGKYLRITKINLEKLEKILPKEHFLRINKTTIISNYNGNIQGWSKNFEEVCLAVFYVENKGNYNATKMEQSDFEKELIGKSVNFNIGPSYKEAFKNWKKIN
jgi:hypothetical protein